MTTRRIIVTGLIASVVMGMVDMVFEAVAGEGFWSPVIYIGATVLRGLQSLKPPAGFHFGGVIVGLMGHMMNSAVPGWIFTALIARRVAARGALIVSGAIYGFILYLVMWYVIVPAVDSVMLNLNATFFVLAHVMWGVVLGRFLPVAAMATSHPSPAWASRTAAAPGESGAESGVVGRVCCSPAYIYGSVSRLLWARPSSRRRSWT